MLYRTHISFSLFSLFCYTQHGHSCFSNSRCSTSMKTLTFHLIWQICPHTRNTYCKDNCYNKILITSVKFWVPMKKTGYFWGKGNKQIMNSNIYNCAWFYAIFILSLNMRTTFGNLIPDYNRYKMCCCSNLISLMLLLFVVFALFLLLFQRAFSHGKSRVWN